MSSSPRMKGVKEAVVDAIPPVDEYDMRPSVKELINEHRLKIDEVKADLKKDPLYDADQHDDLWILRFVLSHKGSARKSLKAAQECLLFRKDMKFCETNIRTNELNKNHNASEAMRHYMVYCKDEFAVCSMPDGRYGAVIFLKFDSLDQHGVVKNVAEEDWLPTFAYINEWSFQWCDYVTRTTGRLTKLICICDVSGSTLSGWNKECSRQDTAAMNTLEDFYPQLMQKIFICESPPWLHVPWLLFKKSVSSIRCLLAVLVTWSARGRFVCWQLH